MCKYRIFFILWFVFFFSFPAHAIEKRKTVGDVNGDGVADIVIAEANVEEAATDEFSSESVYGFLGNKDPRLIKARPFVILPTPHNKGVGVARVNTQCDFNGDGISDILIPPKVGEGGDVQVYWGGKAIHKVPDVVFKRTRTADSGWGDGVGCTDMNGDRFSDLLLQAPGSTGAVHVYLGKRNFSAKSVPEVALAALTPDRWGGSGIVGGGDINGDGYGDVVVTGERLAAVFLGGKKISAKALFELPFRFTMPNPALPEQAKWGDVNGDGKSDIVLSRPEGTLNMELRILYGSVKPTNILRPLVRSSTPSEQFGVNFAVLDLNGDGSDDVLVGAPMRKIAKTGKYGTVSVYFGGKQYGQNGKDTLATPGFEYWNSRDARAWEFGSGIASPGDMNGDGVADLLLKQALPVKNGQALYLGGKKLSYQPLATFQSPYLPQPNFITALPFYLYTSGGGAVFEQRMNGEAVVSITKAGEELVNTAPMGKKYQTIWYTTQKAGSVTVYEKSLSSNRVTSLLTYKHNNPRCDVFEGTELDDQSRELSLPLQCVGEVGVSSDGQWIAYRDRVGLQLYKRATKKITVLKPMPRRCPALDDNAKDFLSALYCIDALVINWSPNSRQFIVQSISRVNLSDEDLMNNDADPSQLPTLDEAEIWTIGADKPQRTSLDKLERWSWSNDGKSLILNYSLNDFKTVEWVANTAQISTRKKILQGQLKGRFYVTAAAISSDKRSLGLIIFEEEGSAFRGYVAQYDQRNNRLTKFREVGGIVDQIHSTIAWTPDDKYLLYGSYNQRGGNIYGIDPQTKANVIISRDQSIIDIVK